MVKFYDQMGLIKSVSQCIKDAEGTAERLKEEGPRLRSMRSKVNNKRSYDFFIAVAYHLKRLQQLESGKEKPILTLEDDGWIRVSDNLPNIDAKVRFHTGDYEYLGKMDKDGEIWIDSNGGIEYYCNIDDGFITHWKDID